MRTYRELFGTPEFTPLFATVSGQMAALTVSGIALGTLVYSATRSPLLSALSMFGPSVAQAIGAATVLSGADRLPPRAALSGLALFLGLTTAAMAMPGLPVAAVFAIVGVQGLVNSVGGGIRYGLLAEIVPDQGYILGRSLLNMSVGAMQICGFAVGGALLAVISARGALLAGAALYLVAAGVARRGLTASAPRAVGRPSVRATWRGNRRLWASPARRYVYLALWVPNGLIVGCEALFIPYSPSSASMLFVAAALGMLAGDTVSGRFVPPRARAVLVTPMRLLLALPYLLFALNLPVPVAAIAVAVASVGYCASLLLQDTLVAVTPDDLRGQALGLHSSGTLTMQAIGAATAGAIAQHIPVADAMTVMAVASALVSLALTPGLRRAARETSALARTSAAAEPSQAQALSQPEPSSRPA